MTKNLNRFIKAQKENMPIIMHDLKNKHKDYHWIWYVFPQLKGLGYSYQSNYYGLENKEEPKAYFNNKYLKKNMIKFLNIILDWNDIKDFFGFLDYKKFHSCMTIFYVSTHDIIFKKVLIKLNDLFNFIF